MKQFFTVVLFSTLMIGCGTSAPDSFLQMQQPYWETIEVRSNMKYDDVWQKAVYIVAKKFDIDLSIKEDGYIRSPWVASYFSDARDNAEYRVKIVAKFSADKRKFEFKIDSQILKGKNWINGSDSRIGANMKKDFMNSFGDQKAEPAPKVPNP